jgi:hypothetical protein
VLGLNSADSRLADTSLGGDLRGRKASFEEICDSGGLGRRNGFHVGRC